MARYAYSVVGEDGKKTGEVLERTFSMSDRPDEITLEDGRVAIYDMGATLSENPMMEGGSRSDFIVCAGLGVNPEQVQQAERDTPFVKYDRRTGDMLIPRNSGAIQKLERTLGAEIS